MPDRRDLFRSVQQRHQRGSGLVEGERWRFVAGSRRWEYESFSLGHWCISMVEVRPWLVGKHQPGPFARALGGPQSPPVRGDRQAFSGGQRGALRLKDRQKIAM